MPSQNTNHTISSTYLLTSKPSYTLAINPDRYPPRRQNHTHLPTKTHLDPSSRIHSSNTHTSPPEMDAQGLNPQQVGIMYICHRAPLPQGKFSSQKRAPFSGTGIHWRLFRMQFECTIYTLHTTVSSRSDVKNPSLLTWTLNKYPSARTREALHNV